MSSNLSPPPKFNSPPTGPGPSSPEEWVSFFRWLVSMWNRTVSNIGATESITINPQSPPSPQTESRVFEGRLMERQPLPHRPPEGAPQGPPPPLQHPDELDALVTLALTPYPFSKNGNLLEIEDTHAHRLANYPAANYQEGTRFYETDRTVEYLIIVVAGVNHWQYVGGQYAAAFANRPVDLGTYDSGFDFLSTDYDVAERWDGAAWGYLYGTTITPWSGLAALGALLASQDKGWEVSESTYKHKFVWTGTGWTFAPGEASQYFVLGYATAPEGGVWHPCDGGTYTCLNADGTAASIVTPNINNPSQVAALMGGGFSATLNAATAPTWATGAVTDNEATHTHDLDAGTTYVIAGVSLTPNTPQVLAQSSDTPITPNSVTTGAGTSHHHSLTAAVMNEPSVANGGLPQYFTMTAWLRA